MGESSPSGRLLCLPDNLTQGKASMQIARKSITDKYSIAMHVDNHYLNSGVDYNVLRDENYYERTKDMYQELYNAPIGFSGIRDDLIYRMTGGGGRSAEAERAIYDFLEFLAVMNLL